jgi:hypothetical protein
MNKADSGMSLLLALKKTNSELHFPNLLSVVDKCKTIQFRPLSSPGFFVDFFGVGRKMSTFLWTF